MIVPDTLLSNNILVCYCHLLCDLKNLAFFIICSQNILESHFLNLLISNINIQPCLAFCFQITFFAITCSPLSIVFFSFIVLSTISFHYQVSPALLVPQLTHILDQKLPEDTPSDKTIYLLPSPLFIICSFCLMSVSVCISPLTRPEQLNVRGYRTLQ